MASRTRTPHDGPMNAKIIQNRIVYDRWSVISEAMVRLPNGAIETRVIEDHGCAAAVLLYDPSRKVALLIRQPRAPVLQVGKAALLEVVAGRLDGKSPEETARAEAMEEAGVAIGVARHVATLWPMPAISTERISLFLAEYSAADRIAGGGGAADENECIDVVEVPLAELWRDLKEGRVEDGKTFTLLQSLMLESPELFRN